jgi:hypothetical protein
VVVFLTYEVLGQDINNMVDGVSLIVLVTEDLIPAAAA